jgi:EAL domain-containing protein (putative c-di-GMP-specific phosphodiesterase class I)
MSASVASVDTATWLLSGQLRGDQPVQTIPIKVSPFVVGRKSSCTLAIPSPTVSGEHAQLMPSNDALRVRDLGSTNGTFVNGVRIEGEVKVCCGDLLQFSEVVFRVGLESESRDSQTIQDDASDRALALIQFDKLMTERAVLPHFQPIVRITDRHPIGYEILGRSRLFGLRSPHAMFTAAAVLDLEAELSRIMRSEGVRSAEYLPGQPLLFANTHPAEMYDLGVLEFSLRELKEIAPNSRIVLEIHEAAVTCVNQMQELRATLNDLEMELAYDDFGAGQARLVELVEVPPDYLKFDIGLVRNIHQASIERQRMLASLVQIVRDLGISALAEGVEVEQDNVVCQQIGFEFAQGFLYGKPALPRSFPPASSTESTVLGLDTETGF